MANDNNKTLEKEGEGCFVRGLQWLTRKLNLLEEGATPPPWKHILLIFTSLFGSSCCLTFLFPFLPEMILHFGYSEYEKGTYGGMVASAMFGGRIFGSLFWGWLADRKGRKKVILMCLLLTGLSAVLFGFSVNIAMAIALRFLCGLVNGIVGTAKASLYDVSDNTNQALGMTMLSLSWGLGMVAGPLVGGIFASPCTKWPDFCDSDSLFGRFPYLLPSLFPGITCLLVFFIVFFEFEETFDSSKKEQSFELDSQEDLKGETIVLDSSNPMKPKHHHLLVHRSFSQNEENNLRQPVHSMLSRSVVSLCPEAEMSISLGSGVLHRQESIDRHRKRVLELAKSEPDLPVIKGQRFDILTDDMNSIYSRSTSHIQKDGNIVPKGSNGVQEVAINLHYNGSLKALNGGTVPIYRPNGIDHKHLESLVTSSQPKGLFSVEDETKHGNAHQVTEKNLNNQPLLEQIVNNEEEDDQNICECCDSCFSLCCTNSSLHKLLRLSDVWASLMLYTVLSFVTIGVDDIFPMFASTRQDYGGLGFTTNEIGIALGFATLPLLFLQIKLYPFLVSKLSIRKTYMLMACVCLVTSQCIPMLRTLVNSPTWLWVCLICIQVPFKIAGNCCFASTSLLINNSAPPELAGQANGLSMATTAIGRTIAPIVAGLLFSWSVTYGQFIGAPFDIGFPFFSLGAIYGVSLIECLFISPKLDKQKK